MRLGLVDIVEQAAFQTVRYQRKQQLRTFIFDVRLGLVDVVEQAAFQTSRQLSKKTTIADIFFLPEFLQIGTSVHY